MDTDDADSDDQSLGGSSTALGECRTSFTGDFVVGDSVLCQVIPFDGDTGTPVEAELVVASAVPSAPTVTLSSTAPRAGIDPLIAVWTLRERTRRGDVGGCDYLVQR